MEKGWAHSAMMGGWVLFCMIITSVVVAVFPIYFELSLSASVTDPIETHIDGLGEFLFDGVRGESYGGGVVHLHLVGG